MSCPKSCVSVWGNPGQEYSFGNSFCRLNEAPFEVLYVDFPSRLKVPVNVLVGLEYLKAGNGWTDEEM
jgi:hypothetical protein